MSKLILLVVVLVFACSALMAAVEELQPGPVDSKDIWTTSVYSYAPDGGGPGGGLDDEWLQVGGWGDLYYTLIEFDLSEMPIVAQAAELHLYVGQSKGVGTTDMYLDRILDPWDWRTQGTGTDRERLWWADRPEAEQWSTGALPAPSVFQWSVIDITDLYNSWQSGVYPNHGIQLRPVSNSNRWNEFYSSDYSEDDTLRPKLVVTYEECLDGAVFPECREFNVSELLFAERYSHDASALCSLEAGTECAYDSTTVNITRESGDVFVVSGSSDGAAGWICDDRLYVNGVYVEPVGFSGVAGTALCQPMDVLVGAVSARDVTAYIPMGTSCVQFMLVDTQREIYGNSNIYLVGGSEVSNTDSSWGDVKTLFR